MALIEVGTGAVGCHVVGIGDGEVAARGSIIDRMTVGVGQIEEQASDRLPETQLQSVVDGGSGLVLTLDAAYTDIRPEGIRNRSAQSDGSVHCGTQHAGPRVGQRRT